MTDNMNHPNMKYPTNLVGPTSSGSCQVKVYKIINYTITVKFRTE